MLKFWEQLTCPTCGSNGVEIIDGVLSCKYCKSKHTLQEKISEEEVIALNNATTDRQRWAFDTAFEKYELLLKKYPDNEMANWGALLCDYGFTYEQDPYTDRLIPTCHRLNESSILHSSYYEKLNKEHQERANELEKLRLAIVEEAEKVQPYDVFICYKKTVEGSETEKTKEASWALEIYNILKYELGLRVFFAEESLEGHSSGWEPHIYAALRSAKLMYIVTSSIEHVKATWVKNEWKRYAKYIHDGEDKQIQVFYQGFNVAQLPLELRKYQAIDRDKRGWDKKVKKVAEEIFIDPLEEERKKKEREEAEKKAAEEAARIAAEEAAKKDEEEKRILKQQETLQAVQKQLEELQAAQAAQVQGQNNLQSTAVPTATVADKYCVKCGAGNTRNAKFCSDCSNRTFAPEYKQYCLDCGTASELLKKFCPNCGKTTFVYTKEEYQKEAERRRLAEIERQRREEAARLAAETRARQEAELARQEAERARQVAEERRRQELIAREFTIQAGVLKRYVGSNREIIIPDSVTSISGYAFQGYDRITSIMIPHSVTSIDVCAFVGCDGLEKIIVDKRNPYYKDIDGVLYSKDGKQLVRYPIGKLDAYFNVPQEVTTIVERAFSGCKNLIGVSIPHGVTTIAFSTFDNCNKLANVAIPNSVIIIGGAAFSNCNSLEYIEIPGGVTKIGASAFLNCTSLKNVSIPDSVKLIEGDAFEKCSALESMELPSGIKAIANYTFMGCERLERVTIPNSVTSIGESAFSSCSNLISVKIPNGLTSIAKAAFSGCSNLASVSISDSVTFIGGNAFEYCASLRRITVNEDNTAYKDIDGNLYSKDGKRMIRYTAGKTETDFAIPKGVTSIGDCAFSCCKNLEKIVLPNGVKDIGRSAFSGCESLTNINIPNGVDEIKANTFFGCLKLKNIKFPRSVTKVAATAFTRCPVEIPERLKPKRPKTNAASDWKKEEERRKKQEERRKNSEKWAIWWSQVAQYLPIVFAILGLLTSLGTCGYMNAHGGDSTMGTLFIVGIVVFVLSMIVPAIFSKKK